MDLCHRPTIGLTSALLETGQIQLKLGSGPVQIGQSVVTRSDSECTAEWTELTVSTVEYVPPHK